MDIIPEIRKMRLFQEMQQYKLLAWDLYALGYQALDFGHIAKDYDSFMKKEPRNIESVTKFFDKD